jgi:hypothetical protein
MTQITNTAPFISTNEVLAMMSNHPFFNTVQVFHDTPSEYRLVRRDYCTYVLQGAFHWAEGAETGIKWIDLPTVDERSTSEIS